MNTFLVLYHTIKDDYVTRKKIFWGAICFLVVPAGVYGALLGLTIVQVIERRDLEDKNRILISEVSTLEENYNKEVRSIDKALFANFGLVEDGSRSVYAYKGAIPTVGVAPSFDSL